MAELALKHISTSIYYSSKTAPNKEYIRTTELFFDKVFGDHKKYNHDFATINGVFSVDKIDVRYKDGKSKVFTQPAEKNNYLKKAEDIKEVFLIGSYKGSRTKKTIRHTQVTKTIEFGGKPIGSKKENKGNIFEREFTNRMKECINGEPCSGKYHKPAGWLIGQLEQDGKKPIIDIKQLGGQNTPRPFEVDGKQPYVAPRKHQAHGAIMTDIDVFYKSKPTSHLSAKSGPSLTFINSGTKSLFSDKDIKEHNIQTNKGKSLLEMCGLDEDAFCNTFNNFGKSHQTAKNIKNSGPKKVNKGILEKFLKTAMGSDYWMIHSRDKGQDKINMYYMNPNLVENNFSKISSNVVVFYGGKQGNGKRVDIEFSNSNFSFKLNVRSKTGGQVFPTHIMLEYKTLMVPGKMTL
jgi:hypothetical protein